MTVDGVAYGFNASGVWVSTGSESSSGESMEQTVYVSNSGKIHSVNNCSGMKNYTSMTLADALAKGYEKCSNCW